jgi:hypothetical protein
VMVTPHTLHHHILGRNTISIRNVSRMHHRANNQAVRIYQ